jgi:hypothetical protein
MRAAFSFWADNEGNRGDARRLEELNFVHS